VTSATSTPARCLPAPVEGAGRTLEDRTRLATLIDLFATLPPPPDPVGLYTEFGERQAELREALDTGDCEWVHDAFLGLYCYVHGNEAQYTVEERRALDDSGGYWCHAGGLSPLLKGPDWIRPDTVSVDLGAGNGLQLLLLQRLAPHRLAVQIEISSRMVEAGRALQRWLGIPNGRVEWRAADVTTCGVAGFDFVYLYRPVRPQGPGKAFYRRIAAELADAARKVVVFSVADCLGDFLPTTFERFYFDGHLACFRGPRSSPARDEHRPRSARHVVDESGR
jgi:SAM-dependent methyltransferase